LTAGPIGEPTLRGPSKRSSARLNRLQTVFNTLAPRTGAAKRDGGDADGSTNQAYWWPSPCGPGRRIRGIRRARGAHRVSGASPSDKNASLAEQRAFPSLPRTPSKKGRIATPIDFPKLGQNRLFVGEPCPGQRRAHRALCGREVARR
jgi:hypothetical protein